MKCGQQTGREAEAQSLGSGDGGRADCTVDKADDAAATEWGGFGVWHASAVRSGKRRGRGMCGVHYVHGLGGMGLRILSGVCLHTTSTLLQKTYNHFNYES